MTVHRPTGRPTRLTPEREARILDALRAGAYRKLAARAGGVAYETFRRWLHKGRKRPNTRYGAFRAAVLDAEADAELECVSIIRRTARGYAVDRIEKSVDASGNVTGKQVRTTEYDWKAAAWWLIRRNPARWAYTRKHKVALQGDTGVIVAPAIADLEEWQRTAAAQQRDLRDGIAALEQEYGVTGNGIVH